MIRVTRPNAPNVLSRNWLSWTEDFCASSPAVRAKLERRYRASTIKSALELMFHGRCAYCESQVGVVDYPHIEHFRPKKTYPRRVFLWSNLFLACGVCNGTKHKGDKFPLSDSGGPIVNPCIDDPRLHFDFDYLSSTREARVVPKTSRGQVTEKLLGLNRPRLLKARSDHIRNLVLIYSYYDSDPEARELIDQVRSESSQYMAFVLKYLF